MPQYQETTVGGSRYRRARRITIDDPPGKTASVSFQEVNVIDLGGGAPLIEEPAGSCFMDFSGGATVIPMYNPGTGNLTGTNTTVGDIYRALYSLYRFVAAARDAAAAGG